MFAKVLVLCAVAAVALGTEYPPGINPALCPDYPNCDMELLARYTPQGIPIPEWGYPYYARMMAAPFAFAAPVPVVSKVELAPAKYPADVDPASCPNYPYCS